MERVKASPANSARFLLPEPIKNAESRIRRTAIAQGLIESTSAAPITVRSAGAAKVPSASADGQAASGLARISLSHPPLISVAPLKYFYPIKTTGTPQGSGTL